MATQANQTEKPRMTFEPQWLTRGAAVSVPSSRPLASGAIVVNNAASTPRGIALAKHRYSRDELLLLFDETKTFMPDDLRQNHSIVVETLQKPLSLDNDLSMYEEPLARSYPPTHQHHSSTRLPFHHQGGGHRPSGGGHQAPPFDQWRRKQHHTPQHFGHGHDSKQNHSADDMPEWYTDSQSEEGGSFDPSGAFVVHQPGVRQRDESGDSQGQVLDSPLEPENADHMSDNDDHTDDSPTAPVQRSQSAEDEHAPSNSSLPSESINSSAVSDRTHGGRPYYGRTISEPATAFEPAASRNKKSDNIVTGDTNSPSSAFPSATVDRQANSTGVAIDDELSMNFMVSTLTDDEPMPTGKELNASNTTEISSALSNAPALPAETSLSKEESHSLPVYDPYNLSTVVADHRSLPSLQQQLLSQQQQQQPNLSRLHQSAMSQLAQPGRAQQTAVTTTNHVALTTELQKQPETMAAQASVASKESDGWFYLDPRGKQQGPFSDSEMAEWFSAGYFQMNLRLRRGGESAFQNLGELIKQCGGQPPFLLRKLDPRVAELEQQRYQQEALYRLQSQLQLQQQQQQREVLAQQFHLQQQAALQLHHQQALQSRAQALALHSGLQPQQQPQPHAQLMNMLPARLPYPDLGASTAERPATLATDKAALEQALAASLSASVTGLKPGTARSPVEEPAATAPLLNIAAAISAETSPRLDALGQLPVEKPDFQQVQPGQRLPDQSSQQMYSLSEPAHVFGDELSRQTTEKIPSPEAPSVVAPKPNAQHTDEDFAAQCIPSSLYDELDDQQRAFANRMSHSKLPHPQQHQHQLDTGALSRAVDSIPAAADTKPSPEPVVESIWGDVSDYTKTVPPPPLPLAQAQQVVHQAPPPPSTSSRPTSAVFVSELEERLLSEKPAKEKTPTDVTNKQAPPSSMFVTEDVLIADDAAGEFKEIKKKKKAKVSKKKQQSGDAQAISSKEIPGLSAGVQKTGSPSGFPVSTAVAAASAVSPQQPSVLPLIGKETTHHPPPSSVVTTGFGDDIGVGIVDPVHHHQVVNNGAGDAQVMAMANAHQRSANNKVSNSGVWSFPTETSRPSPAAVQPGSTPSLREIQQQQSREELTGNAHAQKQSAAAIVATKQPETRSAWNRQQQPPVHHVTNRSTSVPQSAGFWDAGDLPTRQTASQSNHPSGRMFSEDPPLTAARPAPSKEQAKVKKIFESHLRRESSDELTTWSEQHLKSLRLEPDLDVPTFVSLIRQFEDEDLKSNVTEILGDSSVSRSFADAFIAKKSSLNGRPGYPKETQVNVTATSNPKEDQQGYTTAGPRKRGKKKAVMKVDQRLLGFKSQPASDRITGEIDYPSV